MNGSTPSAFGGGGSFGGGFGGGSPFARTLGGSKPGNFATPGIAPAIKSDKPAKPFGAPASDAEDDSDSSSDSEGEEAGGSGNNGDDAASREESASAPAAGDEERRTRFRKGEHLCPSFFKCFSANHLTVAIDDGEAHEATIIQARGRMYYLGKSTDGDGKEQLGWRERGAGILKINVPAESVKIDAESGTALASSFDPSVLEKSTPEKPKLVRLLMRQDSTLRVILNCAMIPGMDFQLKEGLKSHSILFTAIEGADASHVQVQMKVRRMLHCVSSYD